jgi:hypothetical protein
MCPHPLALLTLSVKFGAARRGWIGSIRIGVQAHGGLGMSSSTPKGVNNVGLQVGLIEMREVYYLISTYYRYIRQTPSPPNIVLNPMVEGIHLWGILLVASGFRSRPGKRMPF